MESIIVRTRDDKKENGELTIEATIVMVVTMVVVFFIINMGFVVYHKQMVTAVATRTASDMSYIYGDRYKEPFFGYMIEDYFADTSPFRYMGITNNLKIKNEQKARWYACYFLSIYEMADSKKQYTKVGESYNLVDKSDRFSGVQASVGTNSLNQREITISIDMQYPVLALNPLVLFEFDPKYEVSATATATCIDPMHDMMISRLYSQIYTRVVSKSYAASGINSIAAGLNNIIGLIRNARKDN